MKSFNLRQAKLRSGEEYRDEIELELEPLEFGGERYLPVPGTVPAELALTKATTGTVFELAFTARLHGPCYRCLGDAVLELPIRAREYQATNPQGSDELRTPYLVDDNLDLAGRAVVPRADHRPPRPGRLGAGRRRARAAGQDPLPCRLRRSLRGLRQEPERRAAHARRDAVRLALGGARGPPRKAVSGRAAVVLRDERRVALIRRVRDGHTFFDFPGGGIGSTPRWR